MNNVTILGGGVLGTQIAFQCAYTGKNVTIWLRSEDSKREKKRPIMRLEYEPQLIVRHSTGRR